MSKGSKPSKAALSKAGQVLASDGSSKAQKSEAGKTLSRAPPEFAEVLPVFGL